MTPADTILELRDIHAGYGRIEALKGISLSVRTGEIVTIIGANGAGKSTTLMTICGIVAATAGEITYQGDRITGVSPDTLPPRGLCQVPEGRRIFPRLTVEENLRMGAYLRRDKDGVRRDEDKVFSLFPVLAERRRQEGGTLSGGEQQMLAIGRALMAQPRLLLLDEPSLGLAPIVVENIFGVIREINAAGTTVMLVEQNAQMALSIAHRGYVLATGQVIMQGAARELLEDPKVRKAYLGED